MPVPTVRPGPNAHRSLRAGLSYRQALSRMLAALVIALSMFGTARAQTAPRPLPQPNLDIAQPGSVVAILPLPDGSLVIGGLFSTVGGVARNNLARILVDGSVDPNFAPQPNGDIRALARDPVSGAIYVGGGFTAINGSERLRVARLGSTGDLDATWNPGANGTVNALVYDQAAAGVIAGGAFTQIGGVARACLARIGNAGTGTLDATWAPGGVGCSISDLLLDAGSASLFAAGTFTSLGGLTRTSLAKVSTLGTGAGVAAFDARVQGTSVLAIDRAPGGRLFVGGGFGSIGGASRSNLARLDPDTGDADALWSRSIPGSVQALSASATEVIVGGDFLIAGATPRTRLVRYATADGAALDTSWAPRADGAVQSLARRIDGAIAIGGLFSQIDDGLDAGFSVVTGSTGAALVESAAERPGRIAAMATTADGGLIVGGSFHRIGATRRGNLARIELATGQLAPGFAPSVDNRVNAVAIDPVSGAVFIGGGFSAVNGSNRFRLARLSSQGATDPAFTATANSDVSALYFDAAAGKLYVGGLFTTIAGVAQPLLARLEPASGAVDQAWRPTMVGASVSVMLGVPADAALVIGGNFTTVNGVARSGLARLSLTAGAGLDVPWNPAPNNSVFALALASDSIVAGGNFSTIGGAARNRIARLSRTGTGAATAWNPGTNSTVNGVACSTIDDTVFVAGVFNQAGGQARNGLARLTNAGAVDLNWNPGEAFGNGGDYSVLLPDPSRTSVLVGGGFRVIGGQPRQALAALPDNADLVFRDGFD